ncbi:MAG: peptidoglycan-associated lipoprotein [Cellvibrionales bacterium TMED148]|nr:peptidoglycan-associated lipoprotein [Porticoccaceae bacterium]RPG92018.1 MAG: peptidoglycan-associated lipoprotein [Cellvibrionales bacterium TMED148]|tara:strand:- start:278 stop:766 length:489 start_codon:yes stop_codon:yes gene_type:complete
MKNKLNSLSFVTLAALILLTGCASTPTEDTTTIEEDEVTAAVLDTVVEEKILEPEVAADTVFYFDFDKAVLRDESKSALMEHANGLQTSPRNIRLEGHADERGTREYNMALGERRATAVKEFLVLQGVSAGLIEVVSYGEERAASYGSNDDSWALNRRVELK